MRQLYTNATILTMDESTPVVEAVAVEDGVIAFAGRAAEALARYPDAARIDLGGATMLPAFLDAHSHLSSTASSMLQADLSGCESFDEIADRLLSFSTSGKAGESGWIIGGGYDHNALLERRHPDRAFLDACCPDRPVVLQHASGHAGAFNSRALQALGVTDQDVALAGGGGNVATGYLEENTFFAAMRKVPMPDPRALLNAYSDAQALYASYGIATVQEGYAVEEMIPLYQALLQSGLLLLDVVAYSDVKNDGAFIRAFDAHANGYRDHLRIGGYKIFLDGSPQARTAWMRTPYLGDGPAFFGYGTMDDDAVDAAVSLAAMQNRQLLAHCNGDAACEQYLRAIERVNREHGVMPLRPVMIHAQLLGLDQLEAVARLGVIPSFFAAHVYHWGDVHIQNFGFARARSISPAASALRAGIRFTFHQDTPVVAPNMLETVWCAVNRITKSGVLLGSEERIGVLDALKAVTIHAAYQYGEESEKGSIAQGKKADFVVLNANPLTVQPDAIRTVAVLRTIKDGKTIYVNPHAQASGE